MVLQISDFSVRNSVDLDYDIERNCQDFNCDSICRCSQIVNIEIESIDVDYNDFKFARSKKGEKKEKLSEVEEYCLQRLVALHGGYNKDNYEPIISDGYYGEQIDNVSFDGKFPLIQDAQKVLNYKTDIEKVFFVLEKEYGFIAPIIADCTSVEVVDLKTSDIEPSSGFETMKSQGLYLYDVNNDNVKGIVYDERNLLIDGNHRYGFLIHQEANNKKELTYKYIKLT